MLTIFVATNQFSFVFAAGCHSLALRDLLIDELFQVIRREICIEKQPGWQKLAGWELRVEVAVRGCATLAKLNGKFKYLQRLFEAWLDVPRTRS